MEKIEIACKKCQEELEYEYDEGDREEGVRSMYFVEQCEGCYMEGYKDGVKDMLIGFADTCLDCGKIQKDGIGIPFV